MPVPIHALPNRRLRSFGASFLALFLLLGALDLHPAGEGHDGWGAAGGQVYYPDAAHPELPLHWEQAQPAERPHCPACLHRLETRGAHLLPLGTIAPPSCTEAVRPVSGPAVSLAPSSPGGARAPPLS